MMVETGNPAAVAWIRGEGRLKGSVKFYPIAGGTQVVAEILGLPASPTGFFALHIHEGGNCGGKDFADSGGHLNPDGSPHPQHMGDLSPLLSRNGRAWLAVETGRFTPLEVLGRTVVIHSGPDDFHTQPAGNSGSKIGCGVIRPVRGGTGPRNPIPGKRYPETSRQWLLPGGNRG